MMLYIEDEATKRWGAVGQKIFTGDPVVMVTLSLYTVATRHADISVLSYETNHFVQGLCLYIDTSFELNFINYFD